MLRFNDIKLDVRDIAKVRGYFAKNFSDNTLLHNHLPNGKYSYKFPKIQYRLFNGNPALIAMAEGINVLQEVFFISEEMVIGNKTYILNEKEIMTFEREIGQCQQDMYYRFASPYMALNQENFQKYQEADKYDKDNLLKSIIKNNLKTISKGFSYEIPDFENINVEANLKPKHINFKNIKMICFTGDFKTNFKIPDYWGIGKQSARGFGVVEQIKP